MFLPALALQQKTGGVLYDTDLLAKLQADEHSVSLAQSAPMREGFFAMNNCI